MAASAELLTGIVVKWYLPDGKGLHYTLVWDAKSQTVQNFWSRMWTSMERKLSRKGYNVKSMKLKTREGSLLDDEEDFKEIALAANASNNREIHILVSFPALSKSSSGPPTRKKARVETVDRGGISNGVPIAAASTQQKKGLGRIGTLPQLIPTSPCDTIKLRTVQQSARSVSECTQKKRERSAAPASASTSASSSESNITTDELQLQMQRDKFGEEPMSPTKTKKRELPKLVCGPRMQLSPPSVHGPPAAKYFLDEDLQRAEKLMNVLLSGSLAPQKMSSEVMKYTTLSDASWMGFQTKNLYIRQTMQNLVKKCQKRITDNRRQNHGINRGVNRGIVIGHVPGIGKTMFLNYLLMMFKDTCPQRAVLYYERLSQKFFLFNWIAEKVSVVATNEAEKLINSGHERDKVIVLDDPSETTRRPSCVGPPYFAVLSGKSMRAFKEAIKQAYVPVLTMNPLTRGEAITIVLDIAENAGIRLTEVEMRRVYAKWGGSLRHLLIAIGFFGTEQKNDLLRTRNTALTLCLAEGAKGISYAYLSRSVHIKDSPSHFIIHEWSQDAEKIEYRPASHEIADKLYNALAKNSSHELARYINSLNQNCPEFWWGFETFCHMQIPKGGLVTAVKHTDTFTTSAPAECLIQGVTEKSLMSSSFPFICTNIKKVATKLGQKWQCANEADRHWERIRTEERMKIFQAGVEQNLDMRKAFMRSTPIANKEGHSLSKIQIPQLMTIPVLGTDAKAVQKAANEWDVKKTASYFKPSTPFFGCIDSFIIAPQMRSSIFQSPVLLLQIFAGEGLRKEMHGIQDVITQFVRFMPSDLSYSDWTTLIKGITKNSPTKKVPVKAGHIISQFCKKTPPVLLVVPEGNLHRNPTIDFGTDRCNSIPVWRVAVPCLSNDEYI